MKFAYFAGNLYFLAIWLYFFWKWPNRRLPMIVLGLLDIPLGLFAEYFWWTVDWWHPQTITGTRIGIEDVLLSFTVPSIALLIYKFAFKKDLDRKFVFNKSTFFDATRRLIPLVLFSFGATATLFYIFHIPSFTSTLIGMFLAGLYIISHRRDLASAALWSAVLMVAVSLPVYILWEISIPGILESFWNMPALTGLVVAGAPIEDILCFALAGFVMGVVAEFAFGYRLINEN